MSKHTPGPWRVTEYGISSGDSYCDVARCVDGCVYDEYDSDPATLEFSNSDDKKLVEAAPSLLEALQEARAALYQHYVDWDGEPEDAVPLQLARAKCDAAIAQATGIPE